MTQNRWWQMLPRRERMLSWKRACGKGWPDANVLVCVRTLSKTRAIEIQWEVFPEDGETICHKDGIAIQLKGANERKHVFYPMVLFPSEHESSGRRSVVCGSRGNRSRDQQPVLIVCRLVSISTGNRIGPDFVDCGMMDVPAIGNPFRGMPRSGRLRRKGCVPVRIKEQR